MAPIIKAARFNELRHNAAPLKGYCQTKTHTDFNPRTCSSVHFYGSINALFLGGCTNIAQLQYVYSEGE